MDQMAFLEFAIGELHREVAALDDSELDIVTNCEPWTVRRLASHALNNQLLWAGLVTGQETVTFEDTMGAVAYDGNLATYADEVAERSLAMWAIPGVLTAVHATPFGELPGSVVINFPTIDALCHAWDLSASLGRPLEFPPRVDPRGHGRGRSDLHRRRPGARLDQGRRLDRARCQRHRPPDGPGWAVPADNLALIESRVAGSGYLTSNGTTTAFVAAYGSTHSPAQILAVFDNWLG